MKTTNLHKILPIALIAGVLLTGCNHGTNEKFASVKRTARLGYINGNDVTTFCDNLTHVEYIVVKAYRGIGVTPRIDQDGNPVPCKTSKGNTQ